MNTSRNKEMDGESVILALGGNVGEVLHTFKSALNLVSARIGPVKGISRIYRTKPLNPPELIKTSQPDYLNAACLSHTLLNPEETISAILDIESRLGRNRADEVRWGPRKIDIDLIAFGNLVYSSGRLTVPHPEFHNRDFVLHPLKDVAPDFIHPVSGTSIDTLIQEHTARELPAFIEGTVEDTAILSGSL